MLSTLFHHIVPSGESRRGMAQQATFGYLALPISSPSAALKPRGNGTSAGRPGPAVADTSLLASAIS